MWFVPFVVQTLNLCRLLEIGFALYLHVDEDTQRLGVIIVCAACWCLRRANNKYGRERERFKVVEWMMMFVGGGAGDNNLICLLFYLLYADDERCGGAAAVAASWFIMFRLIFAFL